MAAKRWGKYTIVRVGNAIAGEWTNVGVIVFGPGGEQVGSRMDGLERAIRRGDWVGSWDWDTPSYPGTVGTLAELERMLESTAHAMSIIQCREPLATLITHGIVDDLWAIFISGERG